MRKQWDQHIDRMRQKGYREYAGTTNYIVKDQKEDHLNDEESW